MEVKSYLMKVFIEKNNLVIDEFINAITHGFGFLLSIIGFIYLLFLSILYGTNIHIFSCIIYGLSLISLFGASTLLHGNLAKNNNKKIFQKLDHCAIYLLIAGTYTPITLIALKSSNVGVYLFSLVWALALFGVIYKVFYFKEKSMVSDITYLVMGWLSVFAIYPLINNLGLSGFLLLLTGGVFYTLGVPFFVFDKKKQFNHAIWHLFVLAGSFCHFLTITNFIILNKIH